MRLKFVVVLLLLFQFTAAVAVAQDEAGIKDGQQADSKKYVPEIFGAVKAKFETSLYDGSHRFNVRNSRFGVRGLASDRVKYVLQVDFNNEGKLSVLDSYIAYSHNNLEISLGQQQYHFTTDIDRGPNSNIFANRSFISKFLTTYYGSRLEGGSEKYFTGSIGSRDIGAIASYKLSQNPLKFYFGVFNGSGTNNPEWNNKVNIIGRVEVGKKESGIQAAVSHYNGNTSVDKKVGLDEDGISLAEIDFTQKIRMWGAELHYRGRNFAIESEYAQRRLRDEGLRLLHAAHILGYYQHWLDRPGVLKYISPVGRWDMGHNIEFLNKSGNIERFKTHRATLGVNFGFSGKVFGSELRFNFEKYIHDGKPSDYSRNPLLQDKITIEAVVSF